MILTLAAVLWASALLAVFVGMRTRVKPILLVGLVDGLLALAVTVVAMRGGSRSD